MQRRRRLLLTNFSFTNIKETFDNYQLLLWPISSIQQLLCTRLIKQNRFDINYGNIIHFIFYTGWKYIFLIVSARQWRCWHIFFLSSSNLIGLNKRICACVLTSSLIALACVLVTIKSTYHQHSASSVSSMHLRVEMLPEANFREEKKTMSIPTLSVSFFL
jgi:hypothetical protein